MPIPTLSKKAEKEFIKLGKAEREKVHRKLKALETNPFAGKPLTGELKNLFSLKAWPYRIIYEFNKSANYIKVHKIEHRQGVYK